MVGFVRASAFGVCSEKGAGRKPVHFAYDVFSSLGGALLLVSVLGCATRGPEISAPSRASTATPISASDAVFMSLPGEKADSDQLAELWTKRSQDRSFSDYPLGVGDILEISVPPIEELRARTVRISGDKTITLPFVGKIQAAGLTQEVLEQKILQQLQSYMYKPRVTIFVRQYHSRQVAVLGSVTKPGFYSINTGSDTLLDLISQAGGLTADAGTKIYFIPGDSGRADGIEQSAASAGNSVARLDAMSTILKRNDSIIIDIRQASANDPHNYLSLQVRPGDVILIPGAGQVLVEGWVEKPGAYKMSPGITVAGVIAEAGGPHFAADVSTVKIIRADKHGNRSYLTIDLDKIKRGESTDVALSGGDIVELSAQTTRLIPYGVYKILSTMVNIGASIPIPIR